MDKTYPAFLKALSAITGNLSATWFAVAFITPNFSPENAPVLLTKNISLGI